MRHVMYAFTLARTPTLTLTCKLNVSSYYILLSNSQYLFKKHKVFYGNGNYHTNDVELTRTRIFKILRAERRLYFFLFFFCSEGKLPSAAQLDLHVNQRLNTSQAQR